MDIDELYEDVSNEIDAWDRVMGQHMRKVLTRELLPSL